MLGYHPNDITIVVLAKRWKEGVMSILDVESSARLYFYRTVRKVKNQIYRKILRVTVFIDVWYHILKSMMYR